MITVVSWNIAMRLQAVDELLDMGADVFSPRGWALALWSSYGMSVAM